MRIVISLMVAVGLVVACDALAGDAKKDQDKLQGIWTATKDGKKGVMKFTGDQFSFEIDDREYHRGTFKLNPNADPKEIDMVVKESSKEKFKDKTSLAIYELKGDTLRWCANAPGKEDRPKEFSDKFLLLELRRQK